MTTNFDGCMRKATLPVAMALYVAMPVHAQEAQTSADIGTIALEEVVVTARKRVENLQDTPVSITAFSGAELEARGFLNIGGLQDAAPNLSLTTSSPISGSANSVSVFIRGIGQLDFTPNTNPGVGIYLDGVYLARSVGGVLDLVDVESVDVLKGPQGTLFGRNTIGGAIDIKSAAPSTTLGGSASISYGRYNEVDAKASVNLPISDVLLTKISVGTQNAGGYVDRLGLDGNVVSHEGGKHDWSGRAVIEFRPDGAFDLRFSVDGSRDHDENPGEVLLAANPASSFVSFYNAAIAPTLEPALGSKAFFNSQWVTGPYQTHADGPNVSDTNVLGLSLTATYDLGAVQLKSITAYRELNSFFGRDGDGSPLQINFTTDGYRDHATSQEFQVAGNALNETLSYVGGLYYFDERATDNNIVEFPVVEILSGGHNDNSSKAIFGQATYKITSQLDLTAGLRYTDDNIRYQPDSYILSSPLPFAAFYAPGVTLTPPLVQPTYTVKNSANKLSPEVNVAYHWTSDVMTYVNYSEGYKSGGFTQRVFPPQDAVPAFGPEEATVYEVGAKTTMLNRRLRINAALFHTDYNNVQITEQVGPAPTTENGGKARIDGGELEMQALPLERLSLSAAAGYTNARWTSLAPGASITLNDKFAYTPLMSYSASATYTAPLVSGWTVAPRIDASWRSTEYYDAANSVNLRQAGYGLLNASLTVASGSGHLQLIARVDNALNREYLVSGYSDLASAGVAEGVYGRPRTYLVGIKGSF